MKPLNDWKDNSTSASAQVVSSSNDDDDDNSPETLKTQT